MTETETVNSGATDSSALETDTPTQAVADSNTPAPATAEASQAPDVTEDGEGSDEGAAAEPVPKPEPDPLESLTAERDKLKQQLMRTAADFDNFRRRSRREVDDARMRGKDDAVVELLPVMDNLERAVTSAGAADDVDSVVSGIKMVLKLFEDTAQRMGLNRVKSVGERFDPAMHDAIQQQETDEHPPGCIVAEITPGYMFGKRLIRPAMVVVARAPAPPPKAEAESEAEAAAAKAKMEAAEAKVEAAEAKAEAAKAIAEAAEAKAEAAEAMAEAAGAEGTVDADAPDDAERTDE